MRALRQALVALAGLSAVIFLMSPRILELCEVPTEWHFWIQGASLATWLGLSSVESWRIWRARRRTTSRAP